MAELRALRKQRDALDDQIQRLEWQLRCVPPGAPPRACSRLPAARLGAVDAAVPLACCGTSQRAA